MNPIRFMIGQRVLVRLTLITLIVVGVHAWRTLPRALDPEASFHAALVSTLWTGASPREVEQFVTKPIEDEIKDITEIRKIRSRSTENLSVIFVEFEPDEAGLEDLDRLAQDLRTEINKIPDLPEDCEQPDVLPLEVAIWPATIISIATALPQDEFKKIAETLADDLETVEGVAQAEIRGLREREIWVEVDPDRLQVYRLTLGQVVGAIRLRNRNLTAGDVTVGTEEALVRSLGEFRAPREIEDLIIVRDGNGRAVRVRDLARVRMTHEEPRHIVRQDGVRAYQIWVMRRKESNVVAILEGVRQTLREFESVHGHEIATEIILDTSHAIRRTVNILRNNAAFGLVFVLATLTALLGWRSAAFTMIGIPVSFLATFVIMKVTGITINGVSLFGLILILGILVDDAIIVVENVYRYMELGYPRREAAHMGATEVAGPVLASILTNCAAFLPLLLVGGLIGEFMREIPIVVCVAFTASMFDCFFLLPCHVADFGKVRPRNREKSRFFRQVRRAYLRLMTTALRHRLATVVIAVGALSSALVLLKLTRIEFFPNSEAFAKFDVLVWLPPGTRLEETDRMLQEVRKVCAAHLPEEDIKTMLSIAGQIEINYEPQSLSHVGMVNVICREREERDRSIDDLIDRVRRPVETLPGIDRVRFEKRLEGPPTGLPVDITIRGTEYAPMLELAERVKEVLHGIPGVVDVQDDYELGKEQIRILPDEEKARLFGLSAGEIQAAVHTAFEGLVASEYHDEDEEIEIRVRMLGADVANREQLGNLPVVNVGGAAVPLKELCRFEVTRDLDIIRRVDRKRAIGITADLSADGTPNGRKPEVFKVNDQIRQTVGSVLGDYPGCSIRFGGQDEENRKAIRSVITAFIFGVLAIYVILGAEFQSFIQPIIIMMIIPFAGLGVLVGVLITQSPISIAVMIAVVALTGLVVNDSLILVDFVNRYRRDHKNVYRALLRGAAVRLRPILLTSITTIAALMPTALGFGGKSVIWSPMAASLAWGLAFSTVLTLVVVPVFYVLIEDARRALAHVLPTGLLSGEERAPATSRSPSSPDEP